MWKLHILDAHVCQQSMKYLDRGITCTQTDDEGCLWLKYEVVEKIS